MATRWVGVRGRASTACQKRGTLKADRRVDAHSLSAAKSNSAPGTYTTKDGTTEVRFKLRRDKLAISDWIDVTGTAAALPAQIVEAARKHLPPDNR